MDDDRLKTFFDDANAEKLVLLPCGGLLTTEDWPIEDVVNKYGIDEVRRLCLAILTVPDTQNLQHNTGYSLSAVNGIFFHCADKTALQRLIEHHNAETARTREKLAGACKRVEGPNEIVIAALCRRLRVRRPEDIPAMSRSDVVRCFYGSPGPETFSSNVTYILLLAPVVFVLWIICMVHDFSDWFATCMAQILKRQGGGSDECVS